MGRRNRNQEEGTIRRTLVTLLALCALAGISTRTGAGAFSTFGAQTLAAKRAAAHLAALGAARRAALRQHLTRRVVESEARRRYWLRLMHQPLPPPPHPARLSLDQLRQAAERRARHAAALARAARRPPHLAEWRCIQRYETGASDAAWHTNTGNGYYGGLQFDRNFQLAYGAWLYRTKGSAEHWTPVEQMWTAELAHRSRGFTPWPNTARACGLL